MSKPGSFGHYKGQDVGTVVLSTASGMEARIIGHGAAIQSLKVQDSTAVGESIYVGLDALKMAPACRFETGCR